MVSGLQFLAQKKKKRLLDSGDEEEGDVANKLVVAAGVGATLGLGLLGLELQQTPSSSESLQETRYKTSSSLTNHLQQSMKPQKDLEMVQLSSRIMMHNRECISERHI
jgi:hypothetical protein